METWIQTWTKGREWDVGRRREGKTQAKATPFQRWLIFGKSILLKHDHSYFLSLLLPGILLKMSLDLPFLKTDYFIAASNYISKFTFLRLQNIFCNHYFNFRITGTTHFSLYPKTIRHWLNKNAGLFSLPDPSEREWKSYELFGFDL